MNCDVSTDGSCGLAGHYDWRAPNVVELRTILLTPFPCGTNPCIDPIVGPTAVSSYWASTSDAPVPAGAWSVHFLDGFVTVFSKSTTSLRVRAVRGGS